MTQFPNQFDINTQSQDGDTTFENLWVFGKFNYPFENDDLNNVLRCIETDPEIQKKELFAPDYYIIVNFISGIDSTTKKEQAPHYELITYDKNFKKKTFNFKQLPYRLKEIILDSCMQTSNDTFSLIHEFKEFALLNSVDLKKDKLSDTQAGKKIVKETNCDENVIISISENSGSSFLGKTNTSPPRATYFSLPGITQE